MVRAERDDNLKCYLCVILCGGGSFGDFTIGVQCILVIEEK